MQCLKILLACFISAHISFYINTGICGSPAQYPQQHKRGPRIERAEPLAENLDWDLQIGGAIYEGTLHQLENDGIIIDSPIDKELIDKLRHIMARLRAATQMPDLPYQIHLVDSDISNAACYPGGNIVFFKGIFDLKKDGFVDPKNDDEIAAVIAHEMAHASLRHTYKTIKTAERTQLIAGLASIAAGALGGGALQMLFGKAFNLIANLAFPNYSRSHEEEADLEGVYLLLAAGFEPEASVALWKHAMEKGGRNAKRTGIFSSHPSSKHRMETLDKKIRLIRERLAVD